MTPLLNNPDMTELLHGISSGATYRVRYRNDDEREFLRQRVLRLGRQAGLLLTTRTTGRVLEARVWNP